MRLLQPKAALRPNEERLSHPKEKACSSTTKTTNTKKALPYEKNRKAAAKTKSTPTATQGTLFSRSSKPKKRS